jgi:anhydro-N-acetylmuramic acid kinase
LSARDAAATLTAFTSSAIGRAMTMMPGPVAEIWVCGGGRRNATLLAMIAAETGKQVRPVEEIGLDGDMLEAQAFAWLAARVKRGLPTTAPHTTGCAMPVSGGILSWPDQGMSD